MNDKSPPGMKHSVHDYQLQTWKFNGKDESNTFKENMNYSLGRQTEKDGKKIGWSEVWDIFTAETTLHGLKFIFMQNTYISRRLIWLLLTFFCMGVMSFQISDRIIYYSTSPVNVNVKVNYNKSLVFPVITICNQNAFKATLASEQKLYRLFESMYNGSSVHLIPNNLDTYNGTNVTISHLFLNAGHKKEDLIVSCTWGNFPCGPGNFTALLTDHGLCYKFKAPEMSKLTGANNGLRLLLNIEQYEYMPGPNDAAGVKVLATDENEIERMKELGMSVPNGIHAFIGLQMFVLNNLPIPYGDCREKRLTYFKRYTYDNCKMECYIKKAIVECGCTDFYMRYRKGDPPSCTLSQYYTCLLPIYESLIHWIDECDCPTGCNYILYDPVLSYAATSRYAAGRLTEQINLQTFKKKLAYAREVTNRMEENTFQTFRKQIKKFNETFSNMKYLISTEIANNLKLQISLLSKLYKNVTTAWKRKLLFYRYQIYNVQKNFMRGRDAMEERTLTHVCNSFHEFVFYVETNMKNIASVSNDSSVDNVLYLLTLEAISSRNETAGRAYANYTLLFNAFKTGTPIFRYKFLNFARNKNDYMVPKKLLNDSVYRNWYSRKFGPLVGTNLQRIMSTLDEYRNFLDDICYTKQLNITSLESLREQFIDACEDFYYSKSVMYFEIVDRPEKILIERKSKFTELGSQLERTRNVLLGNLEKIELSMQKSVSNTLSKVNAVLISCERYFIDDSKTKESLADVFSTQEFSEQINVLKLFFQEIRNLDQNIYDGWTTMLQFVNDIWKDIIDDEDMVEYYQHTNYTLFLQNYSILQKQNDIVCKSIRDQFDITNLIKNKDMMFLDAVTEVTDVLRQFKESTIVNEKVLSENLLQLDIFYRQLSYEEINQQEAYNLFSLLCDIGGSMGLFIGASVMTIFELLDLFATFAADRITLNHS